LFQEVIRILKRRRAKDLEVAVELEAATDDPADLDPQLAKKLKDNLTKRRKEDEVRYYKYMNNGYLYRT
jgi:hypothetical protein